jgi:hypothetical protein
MFDYGGETASIHGHIQKGGLAKPMATTLSRGSRLPPNRGNWEPCPVHSRVPSGVAGPLGGNGVSFSFPILRLHLSARSANQGNPLRVPWSNSSEICSRRQYFGAGGNPPGKGPLEGIF